MAINSGPLRRGKSSLEVVARLENLIGNPILASSWTVYFALFPS